MSSIQPDFAKPFPAPRCNPYFFSNDQWTADTVNHLQYALDHQTVHPDKSAGLVIGSGGLPYILSRIAVAHLYVADVNDQVVQSTISRTTALRDHDDWETYCNRIYEDNGDYFGYLFLREYSRAMRSRLLGEYVLTQMGAIATTIHPLSGDIRETVPRLAEELQSKQLTLTFANVTSAANQLHSLFGSIFLKRVRRMAAMGEVIRQLPLADDAIIIDSSNWRLRPELYTPHTYPGIYPGDPWIL